MSAILPPATIGILGGGQLGRMTALAARAMGYDIHVLDPDPECPARPVASKCVTARFDDADAIAAFAAECSVVTLEIEQIGVEGLRRAAAHCPVRPGADAIHVIADRARQKRWLADHGFPVGPFRVVDSAEGLAEAVAALGPCVAKASRGGYDGRGQARVGTPAEADAAWASLKAPEASVEAWLPLAFELSVLVARRPGGETVAYPAAHNHHEHGILAWSVIPADLSDLPGDPALMERARTLAVGVAEALGIVGLLAVELFATTDGRLLVNELAPRPHNSYHASERACGTSQFEQLVRAVCDLPLGDPASVAPAAIMNLLGEVWEAGPPDWTAALAVPTVRLHLYGKKSPRRGRKMGHLSALGADPVEARERVLAAFAALHRPG